MYLPRRSASLRKIALALTVVAVACTTRSKGVGPGDSPDGSTNGIQLTSVTGSEGPLGGGSVVTLVGAQFVDGSGTLSVSFGDKPAVVTAFDGTSAKVTVPAGRMEGPVDVSVSNSSGSATLSNAFTYRCPTNHIGIDSQCVDFATDNNHCGKTGNVCSADTTCLGGACTLPAPMPTARSARGAVLGTDGKIYVVGGWGQNGTLMTVEAYDPRTNMWATKRSLPTRLTGRAVAREGKIHAYDFFYGTHYAYDLASDTWTERAKMPTVQPHSAIALTPDGRILVVGGVNYANGPPYAVLDVVQAYDSASNQWATARSMPIPAAGMGASTGIDGLVYVVESSVHAFDSATNSWSPRKPIPRYIDGSSSAASRDGKIYIAGHEGLFAIYDIHSNAWVEGPNLSAAHITNALGHGAGVVVGSDGRVFVMGGGVFTGPNSAMTRVIEVYDPRRGTWVAGPP